MPESTTQHPASDIYLYLFVLIIFKRLDSWWGKVAYKWTVLPKRNGRLCGLVIMSSFVRRHQFTKTPLTPLCQRGIKHVPLSYRGIEGDFKNINYNVCMLLNFLLYALYSIGYQLLQKGNGITITVLNLRA